MTGQGQNPLPFTRNNRPSAEKAEHRMKTAGKNICFDQKQTPFQPDTLYFTSTAKNHTVNEKIYFKAFVRSPAKNHTGGTCFYGSADLFY